MRECILPHVAESAVSAGSYRPEIESAEIVVGYKGIFAAVMKPDDACLILIEDIGFSGAAVEAVLCIVEAEIHLRKSDVGWVAVAAKNLMIAEKAALKVKQLFKIDAQISRFFRDEKG